MKLLTIALALASLALFGCGQEQQKKQLLSPDLMKGITSEFSSYPNAKCETAEVNKKIYVGCSLDGKAGGLRVFYFNDTANPPRKFYALNGKALQLFDTQLHSYSFYGLYEKQFGNAIQNGLDMGVIISSLNSKFEKFN